MTFFVEVPTPESIDESVPPSDTWERFYALNTEWHLEEYGHTDQLANTLTEFRHSFTVPYTSVWISRYFLIVSGQTLPGKRPNFDQVPAENVVGLLVFTRSAGADSPNFFHNLYITASARRQGFGSEGLAWLREMALSESCTRAETWVIARQLEGLRVLPASWINQLEKVSCAPAPASTSHRNTITCSALWNTRQLSCLNEKV